MRQTEYLPGVLNSNSIGITGLVWQRSISTQHWYLLRQLPLAARALVTPVKHRCYRFLWKPAVFLLTKVKFFSTRKFHPSVRQTCEYSGSSLSLYNHCCCYYCFLGLQPLYLAQAALELPHFSVSTPCAMIILSFIIQTGIYFSDFFLITKILKKCAVLETQNVSAALCYTIVKNVQLVKITSRWQYTTREIGSMDRVPLLISQPVNWKQLVF